MRSANRCMKWLCTSAMMGAFVATGAAAQTMYDDPEPTDDLSLLSIEELADVQVTSVSRRPEPLAHAAAAVFVISAEDIRRSGASSLPEVLRLAPNLDVQRLNAVDYAITARGFNGYETSNKLLVLIDGRSVYSTLSSGVFWDARDLPLENIERIEVISGPGGALYGSNAMNGVINIITYPADQTQGTFVSAVAGEEDATLTLRHGGAVGEVGHWRAYLSAFRRDDSLRADGTDATDASDGMRVGARYDWTVGVSRLSLSADAFSNDVTINENFTRDPAVVSGSHVRFIWGRPAWGGDVRLQAYHEGFERNEVVTLEESDTWDASLEYSTQRGRHMWVVGVGHRVVESAFDPGASAAQLVPQARRISLTSAFVQDQITLNEGLLLTVGAKVEDDSFSGQQFLPNIRLAWEMPNGDLLWGAVSRASRTPNRIERDLTLPGFLETGNFRSETLTAYEVGYRSTPTSWASFSVSLFHNEYADLRTVSLHPVTVFPLRLTNFGEGDTSGIEAWGRVDISPDWRVTAGVSTLEKNLSAPPGTDMSGVVSGGDDPDAHGYIRSQTNLGDRWEVDVTLRGASELATTDSYITADVRLGWRVKQGLEVALVGRNLLDDQFFETGDPGRRRASGRSVYATLRAQF